MPVANIDDKFTEIVNWLRDFAKKRSEALRRESDGDWATFVGLSPLDIPSAASAFSRNEINALYLTALTSTQGVLGDAAALTLQGDYVACAQRAYTMRHATKARRAAWAAARYKGHSDSRGVFDRVVQHVAEVIAAGGAGFQDPDTVGMGTSAETTAALLAIAKQENADMGRRAPA
jgi:hypothetical protein